MRADDGHYYVVKSMDNPQGRRSLVNEYISHFVMDCMGVDTPPAGLAILPELSTGRKPRLHFASRYPDHPDQIAVYDFLPDPLLVNVMNRSAFHGALVCDKWLSNADGRQCIFYRARIQTPGEDNVNRVGWVTQMIDNGLTFQGKDWKFRDSPVQGVYCRTSAYGKSVCLRDFEPWIERLMALQHETITEAVLAMPHDWISGEEREFSDLLDRFWQRRGRIPDLVAESVNWIQERETVTVSA
jgi:hypothetical protein